MCHLFKLTTYIFFRKLFLFRETHELIVVDNVTNMYTVFMCHLFLVCYPHMNKADHLHAFIIVLNKKVVFCKESNNNNHYCECINNLGRHFKFVLFHIFCKGLILVI